MIIDGLSIVQMTSVPSMGKRRLSGVVTVDYIGESKRIMVLERGSMNYVASYKSNNDGGWEIKGLPERPIESLLVIHVDDTGNFDPIAFDNVSQVE